MPFCPGLNFRLVSDGYPKLQQHPEQLSLWWDKTKPICHGSRNRITNDTPLSFIRFVFTTACYKTNYETFNVEFETISKLAFGKWIHLRQSSLAFSIQAMRLMYSRPNKLIRIIQYIEYRCLLHGSNSSHVLRNHTGVIVWLTNMLPRITPEFQWRQWDFCIQYSSLQFQCKGSRFCCIVSFCRYCRSRL